MRSARQSRKLVSGRSKEHEKYPLAANLLIAEFKVRRAAGCDIIELWLRKKMKSKIKMFYGKSEAECKEAITYFKSSKKDMVWHLGEQTKRKIVLMMQGKPSRTSTKT